MAEEDNEQNRNNPSESPVPDSDTSAASKPTSSEDNLSGIP